MQKRVCENRRPRASRRDPKRKEEPRVTRALGWRSSAPASCAQPSTCSSRSPSLLLPLPARSSASHCSMLASATARSPATASASLPLHAQQARCSRMLGQARAPLRPPAAHGTQLQPPNLPGGRLARRKPCTANSRGVVRPALLRPAHPASPLPERLCDGPVRRLVLAAQQALQRRQLALHLPRLRPGHAVPPPARARRMPQRGAGGRAGRFRRRWQASVRASE